MNENPRDGKNRNDGNDNSHFAAHSHSSPKPEPLLPPRGDYQTLLSYQKAEVIYDITFRFAHKYLSRKDRTVDQMIQSARSGKQNILEGSKAAQTSKEMEIKLTNVGRPVWRNCLRTTGIFCECAIASSGTRIPRRRVTSGGWDAGHRRPLRCIASAWTHGHRKSWPISRFVYSTRPTASSTSSSRPWRKNS